MEAQKSIKQLKKFGFTMFTIFTVFAGLLFWREKSVWLLLGVISASFLSLTIFIPRALAPLEKGWLAFGEKMSVVISFIVLFVTFYLAIAPMALFMKLIGKDPLEKKLNRNAKSYWTSADSKGTGSRYYTPY